VYRPAAILEGSAGSLSLSILTKVFFIIQFKVSDGVGQRRLKVVNVQPPLLPHAYHMPEADNRTTRPRDHSKKQKAQTAGPILNAKKLKAEIGQAKS
jgi:hypothetical protein